MSATEQLKTALKQSGQSVTMQRLTVFMALRDQEPLTMQQLIEQCSAIDRASVYRIVALFERLDIVQRLQTGWKYKIELSDAFHDHHHHATCLRCGNTIALAEDHTLERLLHRVAELHRFRLHSHQLELQGYCQSCSQRTVE